jgi:hypothetical protein
MGVHVEIESHDDDSVTLRVGSITARIHGDGWHDANRAAHVLGHHVAGTYELVDVRTRLATLRSIVSDVEESLRAAEYRVRELREYVAADLTATPRQGGAPDGDSDT